MPFFFNPGDTSLYRLTVEPSTRPTPKDMLSHPWILEIMGYEVHMSRWLRQVWEWKRPNNRSKDEYVVT